MNHLKLWKVDGQGNKVREWFYFWVLLIFSSGWLSNAQPTNAPTLHTLGREPWRPQFHFTPPSQWMNDPNGMVYYEGETETIRIGDFRVQTATGANFHSRSKIHLKQWVDKILAYWMLPHKCLALSVSNGAIKQMNWLVLTGVG